VIIEVGILAQDIKSVNGKIIKININNGNYEIISMGHRNPQGLYFDKENNFILETEHGPKGGDEINLIEVNKINKDKIQNYGWAISSAGEHYGGKSEANKTKYEKYPLYKSHSEHGFIEPLKSFVPSIGISEIVKIGQNKYVVSSMKDKSLYFFELNEQKQIINLNRVEVFERVRDLRFNNNQLFLFMEDTASIGVINLN
jgi:glucose/arabinose dehydrogenase